MSAGQEFYHRATSPSPSLPVLKGFIRSQLTRWVFAYCDSEAVSHGAPGPKSHSTSCQLFRDEPQPDRSGRAATSGDISTEPTKSLITGREQKRPGREHRRGLPCNQMAAFYGGLSEQLQARALVVLWPLRLGNSTCRQDWLCC